MFSKSLLTLRKMTQGWLLDTVVPVIGVATGFVGSVFSTDILEAFPFDPEEWFIRPTLSNISFHASLFWLLLIVFSALLSRQQSRNHKQRKIDRESVSHQIKGLQDVLGTMPPVTFMDALSTAIQDCDAYIIGQKDIAELEEETEDPSFKDAIKLAKDRRNQARFILSSMVALASEWDRTLISGPHGATYRANIMFFRSKEYLSALGDEAENSLFNAAKFIAGDSAKTAFDSLDGLLEVDLKMTYRDTNQPTVNANGASGQIPHDDEVKPFALGVTFTKIRGGDALPNLPGAPEAFVTQKPSVILTTEAIAEHCRNIGCFSPSVITAIHDYYSADTKGRSIISWPVKDARGGKIAVINIYRDKKDISLDETRAKRLVGILEPFTLMFRDILADIPK